MSPITVFFLSLSMSADAFAVSIGRGTTLSRSRLAEALRTGAVFGIVEAITPFLGWVAGVAAAGWVSQFDHWLAFLLLLLVGLHIIHSAFSAKEDEPREQNGSLLVLMATALGTSIDAMAVGLSLAFIDVTLPGIITISLAIGFATFILSTAGLMVGKAIGSRFGKYAEGAAGVVLCSIGSLILYEGITAPAF
ncbi:MAG: manganese efflux pump [Mesorhizobium sp.]|nr:manganese efflux pump MntP family protein [Mesorhizobium sp.]MBL8580116.1 manganese efflux pump [Mesorhizobium sp.]